MSTHFPLTVFTRRYDVLFEQMSLVTNYNEQTFEHRQRFSPTPLTRDLCHALDIFLMAWELDENLDDHPLVQDRLAATVGKRFPNASPETLMTWFKNHRVMMRNAHAFEQEQILNSITL